MPKVGDAEPQAQRIAKELTALRQRGLSALGVSTHNQAARELDELTEIAQAHAGRLGKTWDQRGGMKRLLLDGLAAFAAEPEYQSDAELISSLFFDRGSDRVKAGLLLQRARDRLHVSETKFRTDYQNPAFLSFARFLTSWDGAVPRPQVALPNVLVPLQGAELEDALKSLEGATPTQTTPMLFSANGKKVILAINLFVVSLVSVVLTGVSWVANLLPHRSGAGLEPRESLEGQPKTNHFHLTDELFEKQDTLARKQAELAARKAAVQAAIELAATRKRDQPERNRDDASKAELAEQKAKVQAALAKAVEIMGRHDEDGAAT
ncbi:hypothetical protein ACFUIY_19435 [Streptomyces griseorubiginosus]|uniref:hypothetical protein n=1 Tax=Streptomyces griseorubiginosus TaxID=67304 RepID=UPI0036294403